MEVPDMPLSLTYWNCRTQKRQRTHSGGGAGLTVQHNIVSALIRDNYIFLCQNLLMGVLC